MNIIEARAYGLLERMLQQAEKNNSTEVLNINKEYEQLHHLLPSKSQVSYGLCRQSCVLGLTFLPFEKKSLLRDAKARFAKLPVPEGYQRSEL